MEVRQQRVDAPEPKPGVTNSVVRPAEGASRAASRARARSSCRRRARAPPARIRSHASGDTSYRSPCSSCSSRSSAATGRNVSRPDVQRDALDVEPREQLRREVQPRGRRRGRAGSSRVDRLVALGIRERLRDVRRQRRLARGLAVETQRASAPRRGARAARPRRTASRTEPPRRPRERLPDPVADRLEQEHLAARPLDAGSAPAAPACR